ncbi:MAG: hypothetical protein HQL06_00700 [Nitrospirae bacterium]|nr:hypothetical protein [Nitrospirota bacterium]
MKVVIKRKGLLIVSFIMLLAISTLVFSVQSARAEDTHDITAKDVISVNSHLYGVAYGSGIYIAVGEKGVILRSTDGVTWAQVNTGTTEMLLKAVFGNGLFVVVGYNGSVLTSSDGLTWINPIYFTDTSHLLMDVAYGDNIFIASGSYHYATNKTQRYFVIGTKNANGNWTWQAQYPVETMSNVFATGITYGNDQFVSTGFTFDSSLGSNPSYNIVSIIPKGKDTYSMKTYYVGGATQLLKTWAWVAYGKGIYVATGFGGTIMTSYDGITWTQRGSATTNDLYSIDYGNGAFVAVGTGGKVVYSIDGIAWYTINTGSSIVLQGVRYCKDSFIAVGDQVIVRITPPIPTITFTSPVWPDQWAIGTTHDITWTSSNLNSNAILAMFYYDGSSWNYFASAYPSSNSYRVTIPTGIHPIPYAYIWMCSWVDDNCETTAYTVFSVTAY